LRRFPALAAVVLGSVSIGAARPASQELIVYWSEEPWPSIWAIHPDGSGKHRILRNRKNAKRPRLSYDRAWVAFDGAPPGKTPLSDFDVQIVRADGSGLRTLTRTPDWDTDAQWAPSGASLSFTRSPPSPRDCGGASIWIVRRDGTAPRRVAPGCGARWSPDGKRLVYASRDGRQLLVTSVSGGRPRRLGPRVPNGFVQPAGWSRTGTILFTRANGQTGYDADVLVIDSDGTHLRSLGSGYAAGWSPDGGRILYTRSFSSALYVMNADGSHERLLVATQAAEPDWR
jgi:Tol biopolymer transport system component